MPVPLVVPVKRPPAGGTSVATASQALQIDTQLLPDGTKPASHVIPHITPSQVAVPFAGVGHGEHDDVPHEPRLALLRHEPPQA